MKSLLEELMKCVDCKYVLAETEEEIKHCNCCKNFSEFEEDQEANQMYEITLVSLLQNICVWSSLGLGITFILSKVW